jgi:hypothetical protein
MRYPLQSRRTARPASSLHSHKKFDLLLAAAVDWPRVPREEFGPARRRLIGRARRALRGTSGGMSWLGSRASRVPRAARPTPLQVCGEWMVPSVPSEGRRRRVVRTACRPLFSPRACLPSSSYNPVWACPLPLLSGAIGYRTTGCGTNACSGSSDVAPRRSWVGPRWLSCPSRLVIV